MSKYPIYLDLSGKRVVVVGAGEVATRKAQRLLENSARLIVIAHHISDQMFALCRTRKAELIKAKYAKEYIVNALLVIAATHDHAVNKQIYKDCQQLGILCNVVDKPKLCDFFIPAVIKQGHLQITVGTDGYCPAFAGHIRKKLEKMFTDKHGEFVDELEVARARIFSQISNPDMRKTLLGRLVDDQSYDFFLKNGPEKWQKRTEDIIGRSANDKSDI